MLDVGDERAVALAELAGVTIPDPVEVTESNAQTMYREGERLMVWTLLFLQVIYLGIGWSVVLGGGGPLLVIGVAGLLGASILAIVRMVRAAR